MHTFTPSSIRLLHLWVCSISCYKKTESRERERESDIHTWNTKEEITVACGRTREWWSKNSRIHSTCKKKQIMSDKLCWWRHLNFSLKTIQWKIIVPLTKMFSIMADKHCNGGDRHWLLCRGLWWHSRAGAGRNMPKQRYIILIYLEPKWPLFWLEKALFWWFDLEK